MKKQLLFLAIIFTSCLAMAQTNANLYYLPAVQSTKLNPAIMPESNIVVGLPGLSGFGLDLTNAFSVSDAYIAKGDSFKLSFPKILSKLENSDNSLNLGVDIDLFRLGIKLGAEKKMMLTVSATEKISFGMGYPKSLFELLSSDSSTDELNISLSDMHLNITHYREYGFNFAKEINDKLTAGIGVKLLYGMGSLNTERTNISINTSTSNGFNAKNDILVHTSGLGSNTDGYATNTNNTGFAFDLGAKYKVNEKLEVSFSAIDIAAGISWKNNLQTLHSDKEYTFEGANLNNPNANYEEAIDSLIAVFKFDTLANGQTFKTTIPTRVNIGANYSITEKLKAGGLISMLFANQTKTALSLVAQYKISRLLSLSASYAAYNNSYTNFGCGLVLNTGFFQLYLTTDNIGSLDVFGTKNVNFRFGTNLQFGRTDKKEPIAAE